MSSAVSTLATTVSPDQWRHQEVFCCCFPERKQISDGRNRRRGHRRRRHRRRCQVPDHLHKELQVQLADPQPRFAGPGERPQFKSWLKKMNMFPERNIDAHVQRGRCYGSSRKLVYMSQ